MLVGIEGVIFAAIDCAYEVCVGNPRVFMCVCICVVCGSVYTCTCDDIGC